MDTTTREAQARQIADNGDLNLFARTDDWSRFSAFPNRHPNSAYQYRWNEEAGSFELVHHSYPGGWGQLDADGAFRYHSLRTAR